MSTDDYTPTTDDTKCPGCHRGDFPDFDHYMDANGLTNDEAPAAFGAWLNGTTGWDGKQGKL